MNCAGSGHAARLAMRLLLDCGGASTTPSTELALTPTPRRLSTWRKRTDWRLSAAKQRAPQRTALNCMELRRGGYWSRGNEVTTVMSATAGTYLITAQTTIRE
jgi:hypothetical protein